MNLDQPNPSHPLTTLVPSGNLRADDQHADLADFTSASVQRTWINVFQARAKRWVAMRTSISCFRSKLQDPPSPTPEIVYEYVIASDLIYYFFCARPCHLSDHSPSSSPVLNIISLLQRLRRQHVIPMLALSDFSSLATMFVQLRPP